MVEEALPTLEQTVRSDPYCRTLILALIDAYQAEMIVYHETSLNGSGVIVPIVRCDVKFALDTIGRFELIATPTDPARKGVQEARELLESLEPTSKQVAPRCYLPVAGEQGDSSPTRAPAAAPPSARGSQTPLPATVATPASAAGRGPAGAGGAAPAGVSGTATSGPTRPGASTPTIAPAGTSVSGAGELPASKQEIVY